MLNTNFWKKFQIASLVLAVLMVFSVNSALAGSEVIDPEEGGTIRICKGLALRILPNSFGDDVKEEIVISAYLNEDRDSVNICFGPSGTVFEKPALLCITWEAIIKYGIIDPFLYSPDGGFVFPEIRNWGLFWRIPHFSIYYFRRR
ncbi:hypothetical protein GF312_20810 [Candidatus Poribacteria bacterium]|nr:hypothetical protein [Candidatus Poribacteria bacterium]